MRSRYMESVFHDVWQSITLPHWIDEQKLLGAQPDSGKKATVKGIDMKLVS